MISLNLILLLILEKDLMGMHTTLDYTNKIELIMMNGCSNLLILIKVILMNLYKNKNIYLFLTLNRLL